VKKVQYLIWFVELLLMFLALIFGDEWWSVLLVATCIGMALIQINYLSRHQI